MPARDRASPDRVGAAGGGGISLPHRGVVHETDDVAKLPEISEVELRFVEEYAKDKIAVRAALAAGLAPKYGAAAEAASQLLKKPEIKTWVKHVLKVQAKRINTDIPDIVKEWAILGKSDLDDYALDDKGRVTTRPGVPRSALRAVKKVRLTRTETLKGSGEGARIVVETKADIELHDKAGPLKALYEHFHGPLPGEPTAATAGLEFMGRLAALIASRQPAPGAAGGDGGGVQGGDAVDAEPRPAERRVPEQGG